MVKSLLAAIARRLSRLEQLTVENQSLREGSIALQKQLAAMRSKNIDVLEWLEVTSKWIDPRKAAYSGDGLVVLNRPADFRGDPKFAEACQFGFGAEPDAAWRAAIACWAAWHAKQIAGEFVAFGSVANFARAVCRYVDFNATGKRFYLFGQTDDGVANGGLAEYPKAQFIRGADVAAFSAAGIDKVAFLVIETNADAAEALKYFWPKLTAGGVAVLENYGAASDLRKSLDDGVGAWGVKIWLLPTGQGLLLKP